MSGYLLWKGVETRRLSVIDRLEMRVFWRNGRGKVKLPNAVLRRDCRRVEAEEIRLAECGAGRYRDDTAMLMTQMCELCDRRKNFVTDVCLR